MPGTRRRFTPEFKAKVALEALRGQRTTTEIAQHYGVHPNQVSTWKTQAIEHLRDGFSVRSGYSGRPFPEIMAGAGSWFWSM